METAFAHAASDRRASRSRDLERWASFATATAMMAVGVSRRTVPGLVLAAAAAPLAYRGWTGEWPALPNGRSRGLEAEVRDRGIHERESIRLERPLHEVFRFWRRLENLPRIMSYLEEVVELSDRRSRWVARGPAGRRIEWDAEIVNEVEDMAIGWRSLAGSDVVMAGSVAFLPVRNGRSTQVSVALHYSPPSGRAGAFLAGIFGREPSQTIREDLRRVKHILEAGEIPRATRDQV